MQQRQCNEISLGKRQFFLLDFIEVDSKTHIDLHMIGIRPKPGVGSYLIWRAT